MSRETQRSAEKDALHSIWREAAEKRIESGIDWPAIVRDLFKSLDDLRSRLACVAEATYWDRPYDERMAAVRGMCDLTTDGMTPTRVTPPASTEGGAR